LPSPASADDLQCVFIPGDATSAAAAGAAFAQALAGASTEAFRLALSEQRGLVRRAVWHAGFSLGTARATAASFEAGAWATWRRLAAQTSATPGHA
jgi:hypothetical protein